MGSVYGHMQTVKAKNSLHTQSLMRSFTVCQQILDTIECIKGEQMPGWDFVHVKEESKSVHHYDENMPIQIYWKFYHQKAKIFR